jgi:hypothetical protein
MVPPQTKVEVGMDCRRAYGVLREKKLPAKILDSQKNFRIKAAV